MKTTHVALLLTLVLLVSSPAMAAVKCPPEKTCTEFISPGGAACDAAKCFAACVGKYSGKAEGQCFPQQGCRCSYCCDPRRKQTTA